VVHESDLSHKAAEKLQPLQDVFGALFFASVGMLFDFRILLQQPLSVLMVVAIIVLGKSVAAYALVRLMRKPHGQALRVSASLAQIGEFSFILAKLGLDLKMLTPEAQNLIVAGAIISIALNPLVFWAVEKHLAKYIKDHP
jgi:monovalent cation:H+ antiporter-2, CPA2 family